MGTDYSSESGVEVSLEQFADRYIYQDSNKAMTKRVIKSVNDCISEDPDKWPVDKVSTMEEVRSLWQTVTAHEGEAGKYEGDCKFTYWSEQGGWEVTEPYELQELVDYIGSAEGLPSVSCVRIFDSYRQHDQMTVGEPVIIYDTYSVWERTLSSEGKKLQSFAGYLTESSWSDVSY